MPTALWIATAYPRHERDVITPWLGAMARDLAPVGWKVHVLAPSYRGSQDHVIDGIPVHRFRYAPSAWEILTHDRPALHAIRRMPWLAALVPPYLLSATLSATRVARKIRADIIHVFWPVPHAIIGIAASAMTGIPVVATFFGAELEWVGDVPARQKVVRSLVRHCDLVTAISTHTARRLTAIAPQSQPVVTPFSGALPVAGHSALSPLEIAHAENASSSTHSTSLLFVGRLVARKGVDVLLRALAILADTHPAVSLDIVGHGDEYQTLVALSQTLGIADRVRFRGFIDATELDTLYRTTDIVVLPAVVDAHGETEGLGVVLLEALAQGRAVVASEVGGITDAIRHGETGLLSPPGDAPALAATLATLIHDPEQRIRLGAQGRALVQREYTPEAIAQRMCAVYDRVYNHV